jgi:hypothetical protein
MASWLKEYDQLLRGRKTEPKLLSEGTSHMPATTYLVPAIVLGMFYGVFMGLHAVIHHEPRLYMQLLSAALKVPLLFLLTVFVTFPSLYVFSALVNTRLSLLDMFRVVIASLGITLAVLGSLGPVTGFFTVSTSSYPFMKLLSVAFFGIAGLFGITFLLRALSRLESLHLEKERTPESPSSEAAQPSPTEGAAAGNEALPRPGTRGVPYAAPVRKPAESSAQTVFTTWVILYVLVGAQMGWVLRPFIGNPDLPFAWFRPRESNVFMAILKTIGELFSQ